MKLKILTIQNVHWQTCIGEMDTLLRDGGSIEQGLMRSYILLSMVPLEVLYIIEQGLMRNYILLSKVSQVSSY